MNEPMKSETPVGSDALFSLGDKVKFVKACARGSSIDFRTMEGKIVEFSKPLGLRALIKYHGGNYAWKKLVDIRHINQPSPLNALIKRENGRGEPAGAPLAPPPH